jgi:hypothetical protein
MLLLPPKDITGSREICYAVDSSGRVVEPAVGATEAESKVDALAAVTETEDGIDTVVDAVRRAENAPVSTR